MPAARDPQPKRKVARKPKPTPHVGSRSDAAQRPGATTPKPKPAYKPTSARTEGSRRSSQTNAPTVAAPRKATKKGPVGGRSSKAVKGPPRRFRDVEAYKAYEARLFAGDRARLEGRLARERARQNRHDDHAERSARIQRTDREIDELADRDAQKAKDRLARRQKRARKNGQPLPGTSSERGVVAGIEKRAREKADKVVKDSREDRRSGGVLQVLKNAKDEVVDTVAGAPAAAVETAKVIAENQPHLNPLGLRGKHHTKRLVEGAKEGSPLYAAAHGDFHEALGRLKERPLSGIAELTAVGKVATEPARLAADLAHARKHDVTVTDARAGRKAAKRARPDLEVRDTPAKPARKQARKQATAKRKHAKDAARAQAEGRATARPGASDARDVKRRYSANPVVRGAQKASDTAKTAAGKDPNVATGRQARRARKRRFDSDVRNVQAGGIGREEIAGHTTARARRSARRAAHHRDLREAAMELHVNQRLRDGHEVDDLHALRATGKEHGADQRYLDQLDALIRDADKRGPKAIVRDSRIKQAARDVAHESRQGDETQARHGYAEPERLEFVRRAQGPLARGEIRARKPKNDTEGGATPSPTPEPRFGRTDVRSPMDDARAGTMLHERAGGGPQARKRASKKGRVEGETVATTGRGTAVTTHKRVTPDARRRRQTLAAAIRTDSDRIAELRGLMRRSQEPNVKAKAAKRIQELSSRVEQMQDQLTALERELPDRGSPDGPHEATLGGDTHRDIHGADPGRIPAGQRPHEVAVKGAAATKRTGRKGEGDFQGDADLEATWGHQRGEGTKIRERDTQDGKRVSVEHYDGAGQLVGRLAFDADEGGIAHNIDVVVHSGRQRQGIATRLYAQAREKGYDLGDGAPAGPRSEAGHAFRQALDNVVEDAKQHGVDVHIERVEGPVAPPARPHRPAAEAGRTERSTDDAAARSSALFEFEDGAPVTLDELRKRGYGDDAGFLRGLDPSYGPDRTLGGPEAGHGYSIDDLMGPLGGRAVPSAVERERRMTLRILDEAVMDRHVYQDAKGQPGFFHDRAAAEKALPAGYTAVKRKTRSGGEQWVGMPSYLARRLQGQLDDPSRLMRMGRWGTRLAVRATLPFSVLWHAGNAIDLMVRLATTLTPLGVKEAPAVAKALEHQLGELDPLLRHTVLDSLKGHFGSRHTVRDPRASDIIRDTRLAPIGALTDAVGNFLKATGGRVVDKAFDVSSDLEQQFVRLATGHEAQAMARELGIRAGDVNERMAQLAKHLQAEPARVHELQDRILEIVGDFATKSPADRRMLAGIDPFWTWLKQANKFVLKTLPSQHPKRTAMLLIAASFTADERAKAGLNYYWNEDELDKLHAELGYDRQRDGFLTGALGGGGDVVPTAPFTSFGEVAGTLTDPSRLAGRFGSYILRPVAGGLGYYRTPQEVALKALPGGGEMQDLEHHGDRSQRVLGAAAETVIPGAKQVRQFGEQGGTPAPDSTPLHPKSYGKQPGGAAAGLEAVANPFNTRPNYQRVTTKAEMDSREPASPVGSYFEIRYRDRHGRERVLRVVRRR